MSKWSVGIPGVQLIQNGWNGTNYTPTPSGQQLGRMFVRGPKNSSGTYNSIMGGGIVFNSTEAWNDSATGTKASISVTKTGTTSIFYPFAVNNLLDNIYIEGMDNTSSTNALAVYNSSLSSILKARNDGKIIVGSTPVYETDTPLLLNVSGGGTFIRSDGPASLIVGRTVSGGLPTSSATLGSYGSGSYNGTVWQSSGNRFAFFAAENWTNSTQGTWMRYYSVPVGQTASNIVFEITPSGQVNFGVGTNYPTLTETSRLFTRGMGSTSSTYTAQFHNSTGTNNALVIRDDGNIGIGTSTPSAKLTISGGAIMPAIGNSTSAGILFPTDPGGGSGDEAYIRYYVKSVEDTRLIIGNNNDAADDIQINTQSLLVSYLNSCGGIQTNANGAMSCTSDERLKDMQGDFTKGLESIRNINPKAFSWKQDSNMYDGGVIYNGFIAQNIQSALPEAITLSSDGIHLQVSQLTLLAASINAIKELDIKVNNQSSLDTTIQGTFGYLAKEFFGNINNTIDTIFAKKVKTEELCIKDTCVTEEQLKALLNNVNSVQIQQPEQLQPNILENDPIAEEIEPEIPVSNLEIVAE